MTIISDIQRTLSDEQARQIHPLLVQINTIPNIQSLTSQIIDIALELLANLAIILNIFYKIEAYL